MAKTDTKRISSKEILAEIQDAKKASRKSQHQAEKISKREAKIIARLTKLEKLIEDAEAEAEKGKKKKKAKKNVASKKAEKKPKKNKSVAEAKEDTGTNVHVISQFLAGSGAEEEVTAEPAAPDDLEMIAGIGPGLAAKLNEMGITNFSQIAAWTQADITQMDLRLTFPGRIVRENWVEQAKALAEGGREEYVRVFGKEPR